MDIHRWAIGTAALLLARYFITLSLAAGTLPNAQQSNDSNIDLGCV